MLQQKTVSIADNSVNTQKVFTQICADKLSARKSGKESVVTELKKTIAKPTSYDFVGIAG